MGFFNVGRIIGYFFNQLFRWLFWNKTGQKILFAIVIAIILVVFVMLGEVSAAEPENFSSYDHISWDGVVNNISINSSTGYINNGSSNLYYIELNPYNYYTVATNIASSSRVVNYGYSNSIPSVGTTLSNFVGTSFESGEEFSLQFSYNGYKYFCINIGSNAIVPDIYYNAYPFEVSPLSSYLTKYGSVLKYIYSPSDSDYNFNTWYFPVKAGNSYRILFNDNTFTNSIALGFVSNLNSVSSFMSQTVGSSQYNIQVDITSFTSSGSDFVAPADGFIILPGYKAISSNNYHSYTDYRVFSSSSSVAIDNSSSTINTNINQSTSAINDVNNSLTDSSISDNNDDYTLPESGVTDIAESGFSNIFDKLRLAFTSESSGQGMVINVPFTNKSFTISRATVFGSADLGIVGTLINSFWYFIVSLWIVKDIAHKMNMIKSGNIELAQTSNIKEDLL